MERSGTGVERSELPESFLVVWWSEARELVEPIQNDYDMPVAAEDVIA